MNTGDLGTGKKDKWSFSVLVKTQFVRQVVQFVFNFRTDLVRKALKKLSDFEYQLSILPSKSQSHFQNQKNE